MRNAPEVVREVRVDYFRPATEQQLLHLNHRLLGVSRSTISLLIRPGYANPAWTKNGIETCHRRSVNREGVAEQLRLLLAVVVADEATEMFEAR
jgi:hypothetical protein